MFLYSVQEFGQNFTFVRNLLHSRDIYSFCECPGPIKYSTFLLQLYDELLDEFTERMCDFNSLVKYFYMCYFCLV